MGVSTCSAFEPRPSTSTQADTVESYRMNANSIPAAFWFLQEIGNDPTLLGRVRKELEVSLRSISTKESLDFDMKRLSSLASKQSIRAEKLRLRVSLKITRDIEYRDFKLGN